MTTPTNNLIEEAKDALIRHNQRYETLADDFVEKILTTLLTKHEDAVLEREALALEGMKKMYETATPMNPDYDDAFNQALQQAADHLRANQSDHEQM